MLQQILFGKLTLDAVPYHNPIIMGAGMFMGLVALAVVGSLFYFKKWTYLWTEWLTSIDHKKNWYHVYHFSDSDVTARIF